MNLIIFLACLLPLFVQADRHRINKGHVHGHSKKMAHGKMRSLSSNENNVIKPINDIKVDEKQWSRYKTGIGRSYQSKDEELERKLVFARNKKYIDEHNRLVELGLKSYRLELNAFADMSHTEFFEKYSTHILHTQKDVKRRVWYYGSNDDIRDLLPETIDLRELGYVSEAKNQELPNTYCGSCWAFAAVGALEGHIFHKTGKLIELSPQFFIDCDTSNLGCQGGDTYKAFEWAKDFGYVETEDNYRYRGRLGRCPYNMTTTKTNSKSKAYVQIPVGDEDTMMEVIATKGPLSVIFDARDQDFQFVTSRKGDIFSGDRCSQVKERANHGALIVGYGTINKTQKYWLVKNSYGKDWGDNGYFKITRNNNTCGIANEVTYPLV